MPRPSLHLSSGRIADRVSQREDESGGVDAPRTSSDSSDALNLLAAARDLRDAACGLIKRADETIEANERLLEILRAEDWPDESTTRDAFTTADALADLTSRGAPT